ncbi:hypothetical protein BURPS305_0409 [Burkholderia pseudomallei 305]|nr:hypothetical protein BURPS305_0409 [Burkholderia pseudomallei 305]
MFLMASMYLAGVKGLEPVSGRNNGASRRFFSVREERN